MAVKDIPKHSAPPATLLQRRDLITSTSAPLHRLQHLSPRVVCWLQEKVKEISTELEPLEKQWAQIERRASVWRTAVAYSGLLLLLAQFSLFARLTYWEFSWDVMEPVSYFTGQLVVRFFVRSLLVVAASC